MKIYINTDDEKYGLSRYLIKYFEEKGIRDRSKNPYVVFNIDSIQSRGFMKGKRCTLYLEGDEYLTKGIHKNLYDMTDILYILQKNYLHYYPDKTKILRLGILPDWHRPVDVPKTYDYVFVGKTRGNPVYDNRANILEDLKKSKYKILVTEGTYEDYPKLMSSGRIILNIMPRMGDDVCANYRILEGMAIGCMMTDYHPALDDWGIIPNVHYLTLDRFGDISDEEIQRVHEAGRKFVVEHFSYENTINTIIKDIEEFYGR